ncbi:MAG: response regulator [Gemmataceae bacterium]|nr:response regulator [Gemmataceae bacterium]
MTSPGPSPAWRGYASAASIAAAAILARLALSPWIGARLPFVFGFPAVAVAAWTLPFGPALAAFGVIAAGGALFLSWPDGYAFLPLFLVSGGAILWLGQRSRAGAEALAQSEARFRQLADAMPQIVWIARADGHTEYFNRRWFDYVGGSQDTLGHGWSLPLHPDDRQRSVERWKRSVETGEDYEIEYRLRSVTGDYRWFLGRALPARDAEGRVVRWFGTCTDIHDMKLARQSLQEAEQEKARLLRREEKRAEQLRKLANASLAMQGAPSLASLLGVVAHEARRALDARQGYAALPQDGDWSRGLHASSFSDSLGEWRGKAAPLDGSGFETAACDSGQTLRFSPEELEKQPRHRPHPGRPAPRGLLAAPFLDRAGRCLGAVVLSERREGAFTEDDENVLAQLAAFAAAAIDNLRLSDALRAGDQRKAEFLATLGHELRNPLAPVRHGLQVLRRLGPSEGQAAETRGMMERHVAHLAHLLDDLLDLARINNGRIELRRESVRLAEVVARAAEAARPAIEDRRQSLRLHLDEALAVHADPVRLAQAVGNLLSNASRFSPVGGEVRLSARREGSQAVVEVVDDGTGIAADMLERVFDMFVQERHGDEPGPGGLGIGLTLARALVESHGGQISATSPGRGKGSTFAIRLPAEGAAEPAKEEASSPTAAAGLRVLVVDDNHDSAESLAVLLRLMGHEVRLAHDGPSAVEAAEVFEPALALLDIGLPGFSGLEVARRLRRMRWGKAARLIAMTGYGQEEDRRRSTEAGFDRHLVKPIDPDIVEGLLAGLPS